ncbi:hypothetical protein [Saccharopolyspora pogona]|uniref:hypothetical protein n=1 Tax=Saccharopolyspora pogona TaxID=333966 RepID=UPI0016849BF4|nr:hypothetical protein [Saccharopolyspora pogona]
MKPLDDGQPGRMIPDVAVAVDAETEGTDSGHSDAAKRAQLAGYLDKLTADPRASSKSSRVLVIDAETVVPRG